MKLNYKRIAGVAASLALAAAGAVYAQPGGGTGYGMGYGMGMVGADHAAMTAARLADLKAELKITPAQEASWQAFEKRTQQQAQEMQAQMQNLQPAAASTDRTAQRDAMMKLRDTHLAARSAAMKDLYAVLTPEQKAIADQRLDPMAGPMGGRHAAHQRWAN